MFLQQNAIDFDRHIEILPWLAKKCSNQPFRGLNSHIVLLP